MKKSMIIKAFAVVALFSGAGSSAFAQEDVATLLKAGVDDGGKLIGAYVGPLFKGFGAGLNNGWYNTANVHKSGRFDLTISINPIFIPKADRTFNVNDLNLSTLKLKSGDSPTAQTVSGSTDEGPTLELKADNSYTPTTGDSIVLASFKMPGGTGVPISGTPVAQLGIGIYKGTEVMIRYLPTISLPYNGGNVGLFGLGVKHDIKQWIPGIKLMPFDLSAMVGFTNFQYNLPVSLKPESGIQQEDASNPNPDYSTQALDVTTKATTFGLIVSKKILLLTVYAGTGFNTSSTSLQMKGIYPVTVPSDNNGVLSANENDYKRVRNVNGPSVDISGPNSPYLNAGFRLKFVVFTLGANYTLSKYSGAAVNLGVCVDFL